MQRLYFVLYPNTYIAGRCKMKGLAEEDEWLGNLYAFPATLHARASLAFDTSPKIFQKALVSALASLPTTSIPREITIADRNGYSSGSVHFRVGIGNGEGFDILDAKEAERVLCRIENRQPFDSLDLALHLHYRIDDGRIHKVHDDQYALRLVFKPGRVEVLVHHLKGLRRIEPPDLVKMVVERLNVELARAHFPPIDLDEVSST
jgi:hypothetical protein